jgi:hypothetical protein
MKSRWFILCLFIIAIACFYAGTVFGAGAHTTLPNQYTSRMGGAFSMGTIEMGKIIAVDPTDVVIQMQDGSTQILLTSDTTAVAHYSVVARAQLTPGINILVTGSTTPSGVVAQSIQIVPANMTR